MTSVEFLTSQTSLLDSSGRWWRCDLVSDGYGKHWSGLHYIKTFPRYRNLLHLKLRSWTMYQLWNECFPVLLRQSRTAFFGITALFTTYKTSRKIIPIQIFHPKNGFLDLDAFTKIQSSMQQSGLCKEFLRASHIQLVSKIIKNFLQCRLLLTFVFVDCDRTWKWA